MPIYYPLNKLYSSINRLKNIEDPDDYIKELEVASYWCKILKRNIKDELAYSKGGGNAG